MSTRELVDVAVKVVCAHMVVSSDVSALGVGLPMYVLFDDVLYRLMVRQVAVAGVFVGVDLRAVLDTVLGERFQRRLVGVLYGLG